MSGQVNRQTKKIPERPNIVLIMADDMGFSDLGCYGGEISTPNLDRIGFGGMRFSHFYNNAVCVATRASLLTGQYCHRVGMGALGGGLRRGGNNVTFAEVLKEAGYRTLISGKWHNRAVRGEIPVDRGFDRYWGLLSGCSNYFNPGVKRDNEPAPVHKAKNDHRHWCDEAEVLLPFTPGDPDFYATNAFTDHALSYLDLYGAEDRPFLLYLPYTAPHFPLHALPEDIASYEGRYMIGWDEVRRSRHEKLLDFGIIDEQWSFPDRDEWSHPWISATDKKRWDRKMSVYAAMIECMDRGIGRILEKIEELGKEENTLVLFLSDNGGCGEHIDHTPEELPGSVDTYTTVDAPWANASNTPFRKYKAFDHEGGISTPFIAYWPRVIEPGAINHNVAHIVDVLPTLADVAGAEYPTHFNDSEIHPSDGISLNPLFRGEPREDHEILFWELRECRAVRRGKWKAVSMGRERKHTGIEIPAGHDAWELYDMDADRCETNNVAEMHPEIVKELGMLWQEWFEKCSWEKEKQFQ